MCRAREVLEANLQPPFEHKYGKQHEALVMCNEGVFAYRLTKLPLAEDVGCGECRTVGRDDTDLRFHVVFQPRGYMSPSYYGSPANDTRPWDVCPPMRVLSAERQRRQRSVQKKSRWNTGTTNHILWGAPQITRRKLKPPPSRKPKKFLVESGKSDCKRLSASITKSIFPSFFPLWLRPVFL